MAWLALTGCLSAPAIRQVGPGVPIDTGWPDYVAPGSTAETAVVLVVDISASMLSGEAPAIDLARAGAFRVLDVVLPSSASPHRFGITAFAQLGVTTGGDPTSDGGDSLWLPLTSDRATALDVVSSICDPDWGCPDESSEAPSGDVGSCTNVSIGLELATTALRFEHVTRAILLVGDGFQNCGPPPKQAADDASREGISIWTVDMAPADAGPTEGYAPYARGRGLALHAGDATALPSTMELATQDVLAPPAAEE